MTSEELIAEIQESAAGITDVSLRNGIIWLCSLARNERGHADRLFGMLQTERAVLRDVKEFSEEKIAALEKERDELRERLTSAVNTLRDADESEMEPDTWAAVRVAIDTLEGKQC